MMLLVVCVLQVALLCPTLPSSHLVAMILGQGLVWVAGMLMQ
jgi:hypothetical protein